MFPLVGDMEENLEHDNSMQKNFSERVTNVHREKSNKCNLCGYASYHADQLRTHLKMHYGKKSNKSTCVTLHPFMQAI